MNEKIDSYYNNANQSLYENVPAGLERVLEFGCSGGALGKQYKQLNPNTIWHGVDIFEPAVKLAQSRIDKAWSLDANTFRPSDLSGVNHAEASYDAIIYGDVIEHLIDPVKSLPAQLKCLKPNGVVVACIPNIQHWSVVKKLLSGHWDYQAHGILDNTHLRFFTRNSIGKLLEQLDLRQTLLKRYSYENKGGFKHPNVVQARTTFINEMKKFNQANHIEFNELDFRTFQYVIQAKLS